MEMKAKCVAKLVKKKTNSDRIPLLTDTDVRYYPKTLCIRASICKTEMIQFANLNYRRVQEIFY